MTDYYALLRVVRTTSGEEIRRAWKKMAHRTIRTSPTTRRHPGVPVVENRLQRSFGSKEAGARHDREHDRAGTEASRSDRTREKGSS